MVLVVAAEARQLASSSVRLRGRGWSTAVATAQQWKKRRGEKEEEEDGRWTPRISERERGGPNCGSGAPDVQNEIFSLLYRLQPVRGVLWPNFTERKCLLANCSKRGVRQLTTVTLDVRQTIVPSVSKKGYASRTSSGNLLGDYVQGISFGFAYMVGCVSDYSLTHCY